MKRALLLPLLLAACAPAVTAPTATPRGDVGCTLNLAKLATERGQNEPVALYNSSCPVGGGEHRLQRPASAAPHEHCASVVNNSAQPMRVFYLSGNFAAGRLYQRPRAYDGKMIKVTSGAHTQFLDLGDEAVSTNVVSGVAGYRVRLEGLQAGQSVSVCTVVANLQA